MESTAQLICRAIARDCAQHGIAQLARAFDHGLNSCSEYRFAEAVQRKFTELAAEIVSLVETGELVPGTVRASQADAAFQLPVKLPTGLVLTREKRERGAHECLQASSLEDPILTRADIMARLRCSRETVRQWLKAGKLPPPDVAISRKTMGWKRSTLIDAGISI